jgi:hypothetical protein
VEAGAGSRKPVQMLAVLAERVLQAEAMLQANVVGRNCKLMTCTIRNT